MLYVNEGEFYTNLFFVAKRNKNMKKGFTLIELLAVIVILAIIALISTPMILGIIEKAKKRGAESGTTTGTNVVKGIAGTGRQTAGGGSGSNHTSGVTGAGGNGTVSYTQI